MIRFVLFVSLLIFTGCVDESKPLKLGTSPWIGYEGIYQAKEFGWLDERVELVQGQLASDTFKRLISGEVDAATMTIDDLLVARSKGIDLTIVAVLDISAGSDVVLSKTRLNDFRELKHKRIALDNAALGTLILTKMLDQAKLQESNVHILYIPPHLQSDAWEKDQIDIAITYEPFASKLLEKGAYYLTSTHDFPETIFDVLAIRTDRIEGRQETIQHLVNAHFKALEYLHINYQDIVYRIASREGINPDDVKRTLGGVILPSQGANREYLSEDSRLMRALHELNTLMYEKKFIPHKVSLDNLFDPAYLKENR